MPEFANTPPMDEILASIRRIITDETPIADQRPPAAANAEPEPEDDVLELGEPAAKAEPVPEPAAPVYISAIGLATAPAAAAATPADLVSEQTQAATQRALSALSGLTVDPQADANTLDGMVREMLRPMLREWLDSHLPEMVERIVSREVARLSGR